jgi:glyoxylase-like metal-dependent hydrolase (beta-lactamase superfamily II)
VRVRWCDEFEGGFGWIADEFLERCSHALVAGGRVWLIDPVAGEGVEDRVRSAGIPAGVIQLLDRHNRDCAELARRFGVDHHVVPTEPLAEAPFEFLTVRRGRWWKEVALWWPEQRVLVCADALGTSRYYHLRGERIAVHPLLRFVPPRRKLAGVSPQRILCGHGEGIHEDADVALREALATARRRIPAQFAVSARAWLRHALSSRASGFLRLLV